MTDEQHAEAIANVLRASVAVQEAATHLDARVDELLLLYQGPIGEACEHENTEIVEEGAHMTRMCTDCKEELKLRAS